MFSNDQIRQFNPLHFVEESQITKGTDNLFLEFKHAGKSFKKFIPFAGDIEGLK